MGSFIQVVTTAAERSDAEKIAKTLVEKRLAGCVQIVGPVTSTYRWKGWVEQSQEWQCLIKTRQDLYSELEEVIKEIHPYETPEIIAIPLVAGCRDYLDWLGDALRKAG